MDGQGDSDTVCTKGPLVAGSPELAVAGGVHEGAVWTAEMSGEGWGAAEGPVDAQDGRAVSTPRLLGAGLPTHYLGGRGPHGKGGERGGDGSVGKTRRPGGDQGQQTKTRAGAEVFAIGRSVDQAVGIWGAGGGLGLSEELCGGSVKVGAVSVEGARGT